MRLLFVRGWLSLLSFRFIWALLFEVPENLDRFSEMFLSSVLNISLSFCPLIGIFLNFQEKLLVQCLYLSDSSDGYWSLYSSQWCSFLFSFIREFDSLALPASRSYSSPLLRFRAGSVREYDRRTFWIRWALYERLLDAKIWLLNSFKWKVSRCSSGVARSSIFPSRNFNLFCESSRCLWLCNGQIYFSISAVWLNLSSTKSNYR